MQAIYWEVLLILGLILASGLLATSEFAIGSARKSQLRDWSSQGYRAATVALGLSEDSRTLLWTVHAGTTLLGTLAGVYAGATVAPRLIHALENVGPLALYGQPLAVGAIVLAMTATSLVLGDLVPRRIALVRPERIARVAGTAHQGARDRRGPTGWCLERGDRSRIAIPRGPSAV